MKLNVKGTHITIDPQTRSYLEKKLGALYKFIDDSDSAICGVELAKSTHHQRGEVFRAEITLELPHANGFYRAEATGESVQGAIDGAQEEILRELRRNKRKRLHLLRRGGNKLKEITRDISARGIGMKEFFERFRRRG